MQTQNPDLGQHHGKQAALQVVKTRKNRAQEQPPSPGKKFVGPSSAWIEKSGHILETLGRRPGKQDSRA